MYYLIFVVLFILVMLICALIGLVEKHANKLFPPKQHLRFVRMEPDPNDPLYVICHYAACDPPVCCPFCGSLNCPNANPISPLTLSRKNCP